MIWGHRRRFLGVAAALSWPVSLSAETDGPDAAGWILIDSVEDDGPPVGWVDMADSDVLSPGLVSLPFAFAMGDDAFDEAMLGANGSLIFDGSPADCPGAGSWTGFLTGASSETIQYRSLGRYPGRGLAWDWGSAWD